MGAAKYALRSTHSSNECTPCLGARASLASVSLSGAHNQEANAEERVLGYRGART